MNKEAVLKTIVAKEPIMTVIVRNYGCLPPLNWGDDCQEHLYLMNVFWNRLVEIEQANRAAYRALVDADDQVSVVNAEIEEIKAEIEKHGAARNEARKQHRAKTGPHTAPHDQAIKDLKARLKEVAATAKDLRRVARAGIKEPAAALEAARREQVKAAYAASGLWWGNYNAVIDSYNVARSRAMKDGSELRFHRFDGSGRFTCQIQGGMSIEDLTSARHNIASLRLLAAAEFAALLRADPRQESGSRKGRRQYGLMTVTVYTGQDAAGAKTRRTLDLPVILHRPLPEEGTLKTLSVIRKRVGPGDYRWSVTFTLTADTDAVVHPSPLACGINIGWKQVKDGLRVATLLDGHGHRHIVLPQVILDKLSYIDDLKSRIDTATNDNCAWLLAGLPEPPEALREAVAKLRRARKPHPVAYARLVMAWRQVPDYAPDLRTEAETRRKAVKRLELEHANLRDKVLARRLDYYRVTAKAIAEKYGRIALDKIDLRQMAALVNPDGSPNELAAIARTNRTRAAVSEFREWIVKQAAKTGSVIEVFGIKSTQTCSMCGKTLPEATGLTRTCLSCGGSIDTDVNAAANLLRALQG